MKKTILKICILSLILFVISTIVILISGRTLEISYAIGKSQNYHLEMDNNIIEILDEKVKGDNYIVKIKSKAPGKANIYLIKDSFKEGKYLYVHKSLIITDNNYFGYSRNSEVIPISITIIMIYILYLLIKEYNKSKKENLYQYKNIAYMGIIVFISFFIINTFISIFNYNGLYSTISDIINSMSFVSFFLFPVALITFSLVTISNIKLIIKEGFSIRNLLGVFFGIFICLATLFPDYLYRKLMTSQIVNIYNLNGPGPYIYNFFEAVIYLTISYLECILIGTVIIGFKSAIRKINYDKDYIVILGCQIKKDGSLTPLLKGRVDRALKFRNEQLEKTGKDLIFIPSGGKGDDEVISEAEAMKKYLISQSIDEKNILIENKSKNTYENIKFSNKLTKKNSKVCFSTTNYHVLRAGLIATEQGLILEGIGSKTKAYFWINAFIREFIGTLYSEKKKHILVFILIVISIITMIIITYFANNI